MCNTTGNLMTWHFTPDIIESKKYFAHYQNDRACCTLLPLFAKLKTGRKWFEIHFTWIQELKKRRILDILVTWAVLTANPLKGTQDAGCRTSPASFFLFGGPLRRGGGDSSICSSSSESRSDRAELGSSGWNWETRPSPLELAARPPFFLWPRSRDSQSQPRIKVQEGKMGQRGWYGDTTLQMTRDEHHGLRAAVTYPCILPLVSTSFSLLLFSFPSKSSRQAEGNSNCKDSVNQSINQSIKWKQNIMNTVIIYTFFKILYFKQLSWMYLSHWRCLLSPPLCSSLHPLLNLHH